MIQRYKNSSGSALLGVIIFVLILTALAGTVLLSVGNGRHTMAQAAVWKAALDAAEAGAHLGAAQLDQELATNPDAFLSTSTSGALLVPATSLIQPYTYQLPPSATGEASGTATASYVITGTYTVNGTVTRPYFIVSSTGTVPLSGNRMTSSDSKDVVLRKLFSSGTDAVITSASRYAKRVVELWVRPVYNTDTAILTGSGITGNGYNLYVDGFNSSLGQYPYVTSGSGASATYDWGHWDSTNGYLANVASDSSIANVNNMWIGGDVMTNGGSAATTDTRVQGITRNDFFQPIGSVGTPTGTFSNASVSNGGTLNGGTVSNPAQYIVNGSGNLSLTGQQSLIFDFGHQGGSNNSSYDYTKNYIVLYVPGNFSMAGQASVVINGTTGQELHVKIYVGGNFDNVGGATDNVSWTNNNTQADSLQLFGISTAGTTPTWKFAGNSTFYGIVDAPSANVTLNGNVTFVGSMTANTVTMRGNANFWYDEAIGGSGLIVRFAVANWFEDTKTSY